MSVSVKWAVLKGLLALMEYLVAAAAVAGNEIEILVFEAQFDNLNDFLFHFPAEFVWVFKVQLESEFEVEKLLSDFDSNFALHFVFYSEAEQHNEHMIEAESTQFFSN